MLINCHHCNSRFAVNAEEVGFDGRLVKCGNCGKEWFQESKAQILEKKLIELDRNLHAKEVELIEQKNQYNDKITRLEKSLKAKKQETEEQKLIEGRVQLFESRIKEKEKEIEEQTLIEKKILKLEKQIEKSSLDNFIKNTALEKRTSKLQEKINSETLNERLEKLEKEFSGDSNILESAEDQDSNKEKQGKSSKKERIDFFEDKKPINSSNWNLDEEVLTKELDEIKKKKVSKELSETREDENLSAIGSLKYKQ